MHLYQDTFYVNAFVDKKDREINRAIFTFVNSKGKREEYPVLEKKGSAGQYELQVDDMLKKVDNGSRLYVRLEDKELIMEGSDSHITYPTVDTGLVFYVENEVIVPKYFEMNGTEANAVNMPVLGEIRGTTSSGKFGMSRVDYGDKVGYSLLVNLNALVFNNKPALNNTQKESMVTEFIGLAKETTENKKKWAGTVINETTKGKEEAAKTSEKPLKEQTKDYEKTAKDAKETPNAFAANDKNKTTFSANVIVMLAYDFAYNSETDEYDMYQFAITIGGSFDVNKMFYTAVVYVPVFLNIYGYLQGSITVGSITAQKGDGITGSDFSRYAENVATYLEDNWEDYSLLFQLMPRVKGQIGAGICGVLSARGYLKFDFQFDIGSGMSKSGALMEGTGGIGFDILVGTIDFDLLTGRVGCGSLENSGEFLFFDGLAGDLLAVKGKDSRLLYKTSNQMLSYKDYDFGTSDMASFAPQKVRAQPGEVSRTVLLNNAAERTRPNIVDLKDGKKLITFLGAKKGEAEGSDYMCLYYSIFDGSSWSTPKPVSDDGTFDTTPTILKGENRVAIAWSNASRAFTSKDTEKDKLQCLGISMSILDLNTMKFSEQIDIVKDSYLNSNPQLTMAGSKVYCTYMKRDISEVTEIAQLTDIAGTYYTMAFKEYDMVTKEHTDELFVVTRNDANVSDPYVLSYDSQAASITATAADGSEGTADLLINAFVIDTDHLLDTPEDREVYLEIYDTNRNKKYFPIRITDNAVGDEQVQLTDIGGKVYMTWVEDGAKMMVYDVTELAEALYNQQLAGDRYINADAEDKNWYKAERFEIIITEELKEGSTTTTSTHDAYEGSVYDEIRQGIFRIASSNIRDSEDYQVSIHEYQLVTDGRDIYILYTAPCNDYDKDGVDLYGMRYSEAENLFTPSVQITDDEFVMDEFSAVMREDDTISLVCNYFTQTISEEVGMIFSPNTLVEIEFEPKGSLTIDGDRISIDDDLIVGETVPIKFAVKNEGLLTSKGYTVKVEYEKNGSKTTILEEDVDSQNVTAGSEYRPAENPVTGVKLGTLASGESAEFSVAWKVPKNAIGGKLVVTVTENGVTSNAAYKAEHEITGGSELVINDASATKEGGKIIYEADIYNKGNQASSLAKFKLYKTVSNDERVLIETIDIDGLESGEKTTIKTEYIIEEDDFNSYGVIALRGEVGEGEEPDSSFNSRVKYSEPAIMKINDDAETLYLKRNGRAKLDVTYLPWSSKEADIIYFSKDNSIATVDKNGQVKAEGRGETLIVAYMKGVGIKDVIKVNVDNSPSSGGGSAASPNEMKISDTENGARAEFNGTPIENGAEVTITSNQATELLKAVEGEEALEIIVDAKGAKADERFAVTIPKKLVEGLSKEKVKQLRIVSSAGTVMLKPDSLAAENGNQYRVEITKLQPEANGILQALEVDVLADGKSIKGELELSIPVSEDSIDRLMDKNNAIILVYPPDNQVKVINTAITGNEAVLKLPANSQAKLVESDKGFGITGDFKQIMPTLQQVRRNGEGVGCEIYNIDGYNYFKLRDISLLMKGLETEFSIAVGENQSILVNTDGIYESLGTELKPGTDNSKTCVKSEWTLTVDGYTYPVWCYNIGGYNYFQLRTLGIALGFDVGYDINTNCVDITAK